MRRLLCVVLATGLLLVSALPAMAGGVSVWHVKDAEWAGSWLHENPCTGNMDTVTWVAEHRTHGVDFDGDGSTLHDQLANMGVMKVLSATHSDPDWVVDKVGDSLVRIRWDDEVPFGDDEERAAVAYRVWLKTHNRVTGEKYNAKTNLHWVANARGEVVVEMNEANVSRCK